MTEKNFAAKFAALRKENGITQQSLGDILGVSNRAGSKWETGLALPSTENILKLSKIFGVSVDYFLASEEKEQKKPISAATHSTFSPK